MLIPSKRQRRIYVEMAPRTGSNTWGSWVNLTPWFLEQESDITYDVDDESFEGRIEQENIIIKFNNLRGNFRQSDSDPEAIWGSSEYIYHSRIKFYDWIPDDDSTEYGSKPLIDPIIDGLIALELKYNTDYTISMSISSRLDILKEHYIVESLTGKIRTVTSQSVIRTVVDLLDSTYPSLGINTNGGIVRNSVLYTDVTPYDRNLLEMLFEVIDQGGAVGGLIGDDFFVSFPDFQDDLGTKTITQANLENVSNTELLYHFDDTDYNSGSGTSLDDKSSNNLNAGINTTKGLIAGWETTGLVNNSATNFYVVNDDGLGDPVFTISSFTVDILMEVRSFNGITEQEVSGAGTKIPAPVVAFTESTVANPTAFTASPVAEDVKVAGLVLTSDGKIAWMTAKDNLNYYISPKSYIIIDDIPGENSKVAITLSFDSSTGDYKFYIDGVFRKAFTDSEGYSLDEFTKIGKVVCRGALIDTGSSSVDREWIANTYRIQYSGFRLVSSVRTDAEILGDYIRTYGQEYDIYTASQELNTHTNRTLLRLDKYDNGSEFVKNYILYERNIDFKGAFEFGVSSVTSLQINFNFAGEEQIPLFTTGLSDLVDKINWADTSNTTNFDRAEKLRETYGVSIEFGSGISTASESVIIKFSGKFDYRKVELVFVLNLGGEVVTDSDRYFLVEGLTGSFEKYIAVPSPADITATIISKDDDSILKYGKKIHRMKNYDLVSTTLDKKLLTRNYLASRAIPRDRLFVKVPFRHVTDLYKRVIVSLDKENTSQIPFFFQEGGNFIDWLENGDYREKEFYTVGIRHNKEGHYTQLRLREADFSVLTYSPLLWLDGNDTDTIIESSNVVSEWKDKSGNDNHVTQATEADKPTYVPASGYIRFVNGDSLNNTSPNGLLSNDGDYTLFLVHNVIDPTTSTVDFPDILFFESDAGVTGVDRRPLIYYHKALDLLTASYNSTGGASFTPSTNTGKGLITNRRNSTTNYIALNGTVIDTDTQNDVTETNLQSIQVGDLDNQNLNIDHYEIIYFNRALSDSEVAFINNYLLNKWEV